MRISIDELFMKIAHVFKLRSTCARAQVGCVIVTNKRVISSGCNGPKNQTDHTCTCNLENPCKESIHAEANAIYYAAQKGISTLGSTMYCTHSPCRKCAEAIAQSGISEVVYHEQYRDITPLTYLQNHGVRTREYGGLICEHKNPHL